MSPQESIDPLIIDHSTGLPKPRDYKTTRIREGAFSKLWPRYLEAKDEFAILASDIDLNQRTKAARFLRDTTENAIRYIKDPDHGAYAADTDMLEELYATLAISEQATSSGLGGRKRKFDKAEEKRKASRGPILSQESSFTRQSRQRSSQAPKSSPPTPLPRYQSSGYQRYAGEAFGSQRRPETRAHLPSPQQGSSPPAILRTREPLDYLAREPSRGGADYARYEERKYGRPILERDTSSGGHGREYEHPRGRELYRPRTREASPIRGERTFRDRGYSRAYRAEEDRATRKGDFYQGPASSGSYRRR